MTPATSSTGWRRRRTERASADDELNGFAADDELNGLAADDELNGFAADEDLNGFGAEDELNGLRADDELNGFAADEDLNGIRPTTSFSGIGDEDATMNGYVRRPRREWRRRLHPERPRQTPAFSPSPNAPMWAPIW